MSTIKFTPIIGGIGSLEAHCYLLDIDDCRILLDCGWDSKFNTQQYDKLEQFAKTIDIILISHSDMLHMGALVYVVKRFSLDVPILCTTPLYHMGQKLLYDAYESKRNEEDFQLYNLDDVDFVSKLFIELKFSQKYDFDSKDVEFSPQSAGHTLGGSIWRITKGTEEIIYAVDFNHKPER